MENSGFFTDSLAYDIKWCAWNFAWVNVAISVGNRSEKLSAAHRVKSHCLGMIGGTMGELEYD